MFLFKALFYIFIGFYPFFSFGNEELLYFNACSLKESDVAHLESGYFASSPPQIDKIHKTLSLSLLDRVLSRLEAKIKETSTMMYNIRYCAESRTEPDCLNLVSWVENDLAYYVLKMRMHAALAQSPHNISTFFMEAEKDLNKELSFWSLEKFKSWEPLTADEEILVSLNRENNLLEIEKYITSIKASEQEKKKLRNEILLDANYRHYVEYQKILGELPFFQFLTQAKPTYQDVLHGLNEMEKLFLVEKQYISEKRNKLELIRNTSLEVRSDLLELLDYTRVVEEVLYLAPAYCSIATALKMYKDHRILKLEIAYALPILVSSFILPPVTAFVTGIGAGVGYGVKDYFRYKEKRGHLISYFYGDESGADLEELSLEKRMFQSNLILAPLTFGIFGGSISKVKDLSFVKKMLTRIHSN